MDAASPFYRGAQEPDDCPICADDAIRQSFDALSPAGKDLVATFMSPRIRDELLRLGVLDSADVHVVGDGAAPTPLASADPSALEGALQAAISMTLPIGVQPQPAWWLMNLGIPGAPIVSMSRDERAGPLDTLVVFTARGDAEGTRALQESANPSEVRTAPFSNMALATPDRIAFITLPHMFHMTTEAEFIGPLLAALAAETASAPVAVVIERCRVLILQGGRMHDRPQG